MILLEKTDILEIHRRALAEHGGSPGLRDEGALESAIAAVRNRIAYEEAGVIECAATYAFHLTQAHAFIDGNKRVGAAAMLVFLAANDVDLRATEDELYDLFLSIASSASTRSDVEHWLRARPPR